MRAKKRLQYLVLNCILLFVMIHGPSCGRDFPNNQEDASSNVLEGFGEFRDSPAYRDAELELQKMGTNAVPLLMEEMRRIGKLLDSNNMADRMDAGERRARLRPALRVLGSAMTPFADELIEEFFTGKNPADAALAVALLEETHAVEIINGLRHASENVRIAAIVALRDLPEDSVLRGSAVEPLLALLEDDSREVRVMAAQASGYLRLQPEVFFPALLERLKDENEDMFVRLAALSGMGRFGLVEMVPYREALAQVAHAEGDSPLGARLRAVLVAFDELD